MKRPQHKKNKSNPLSEETPIVDERNLVDADASAEMSIEDRTVMYWMENKSFVIGCIIFLAGFITLINGFRIYQNYASDQLQADYSAALAAESLDAFAGAHADHAIGGFAALSVADVAFNAKDFERASEFYELATQALKGNILAGRAHLGHAFALAESTQEADALAELGSIAANNEYSQSIRAEAAYHLAVHAFSNGQVEAFDSYVAQVSGFEQATQWNRRLQYYVEQAH